MKRLAVLASSGTALAMAASAVSAQEIENFHSFNATTYYDSWTFPAPFTKITSAATYWETESIEGYGSCYYDINSSPQGPAIDISGSNALQLSFTVNSGDAGIFVDLEDGEGDFWQWFMGGYGLGPGTYVFDEPLNAPYQILGSASTPPPGGFDFTQITAFHLELDPGATGGTQNPYDVTWTDLSAVTVTPSLTWNNTGASPPSDGVTWDATNNNWNNGSAATTYSDGAAVTFNDTNNGHYAVTLTSTVSPGSVTVNNSSNNYTISGMGGKIADAGAFTKSGTGTLTLGVALSVGSMSISGGTLKLATGISGGTGPAVSSTINLTSLSITSNGVLDVNNDHIIITYGATDPFSTIAGYIKSGYNGGGWNGPGIISSAAQTKTNGLSYGVGYADGKDGKVAGLTSGQIEVAYTLLGDANLDGLVNAADFTILAANFNQPVTGWDQGDFNYDGLVNAADFTDLAANFNQSVSGAAVSAGDVAALDAFAAANGLLADVPEPASAALMVMAGLGILARRRPRSLRRARSEIA